MLGETPECGWVWLEQAERGAGAGGGGRVGSALGTRGRSLDFTRGVMRIRGLRAGERQDLTGTLFESVWPLPGEWVVRGPECTWGYSDVDLAQGGRTEGDRRGSVFRVELIAFPGGFKVGEEKEEGVKSGQLGSKDLGFLSLPKEAAVEGFLQPDLRSAALEPTGK